MSRRLSIRTQFLLIISVSLLLATLSISLAHLLQERAALVDAERRRGEALIDSIYLTVELADPDIFSYNAIPDLLPRLREIAAQNEDIEFIALVSPEGYVYAHSEREYIAHTIGELADPTLDETVRAEIRGFAPVYLTVQQFDSPLERLPGQFNVFVAVAAVSIDAQQRDGLLSGLLLGLGAAVITGLLTFLFLHFQISIPVRRLSTGAAVFGRGDLSYRIRPAGSRELYDLATMLNQTAAELEQSRVQIQDSNRVLEQRVEERTRDLATVAEVAGQVSTILSVPDLLQAVTDLTCDNFDLYHAHIYLLDEDGQTLALAAGSGEVGRQMVAEQHTIPLNARMSLVARAARTRQVIVQNDVREAPDFLPNPLLPDTRAELAVALVARGELIGVLDVQSAEGGRFGDEMRAVMSTLAQQIAVALSNARLFGEVERAGRHEHVLSAIGEQIQGATSMDEVLEVAARELGKALRVPHTTIELQLTPEAEQAPR